MIFYAKSGMWDTWIYEKDGVFHLFWLQGDEVKWDSIGLAISSDLIHWKEIGTVIEKSPEVEEWMGTGRTWKAEGKFYINYSEVRHAKQEIHIAESDDLVHWKKLSDDYTIKPDQAWYVTEPHETPEKFARWDCLNPVQKDNGTYVGFLSAHGKSDPLGACNVVGTVESEDGIKWKVKKPASVFAKPLAEISGYARFQGRHYIFISTAEDWGPRYDRYHDGQQANGIWYWVSNDIDGPYVPPDHFNLLQGQISHDYMNALFGTAFKYGDKWLWNHHWKGHDRIWLGPVKELIEESPGYLALQYWDGNEKMKGDCVWDHAIPETTYPQPVPNRPLCARWDRSASRISGYTEGATGLALINLPETIGNGCMVTCRICIERNNGDGAGLFISGDQENTEKGVVILLNPKGMALVGRTMMGYASPRLVFWERFEIAPFKDAVDIRAIIRREFVEIYAGERLLRDLKFRPGEVFSGRFGLWIDRCGASLDNMKVWKLNI